jgi:hypothetical protein
MQTKNLSSAIQDNPSNACYSSLSQTSNSPNPMLYKPWPILATFFVAYVASYCQSAESSTGLDPEISSQLQKTELLLSEAVKDTPNRPKEFDQYLKESNPEALDRVMAISQNPDRSVTFVLGNAGVGKSSFIRILQKQIKDFRVVSLSQIKANGYSEFKDIAYEEDDLVTSSGFHYVFGRLPAIRNDIKNWLLTLFGRFGVTKLSGTIMIDDLDEIYPGTAKRILNDIITNVGNKSPDVLDVVLFGRPEAFLDFYNQPNVFDFRSIKTITLNGVRDYYYTDFLIAAVTNFSELKKFKRIEPSVLVNFLRQHQDLVITMANRAQAQFLIQALASGLKQEKDIKASIYNALMDRAHESHNRPTQETRLYDAFFRDIARMYAPKIDPATGYFPVAYLDTIDFTDQQGHAASVKVIDVLNRSGIAEVDPVDFSQRKYRFEPFWLHRYLAEEPPAVIRKDLSSEFIQQVEELLRGRSMARMALFGFGIAFFFILIVIALFVPVVSVFQEFVFRLVLSLAAGGIGASIPGFLNIHFNLPFGALEAGGALALFAVCYLVNPPALVPRPKGGSHKEQPPISSARRSKKKG